MMRIIIFDMRALCILSCFLVSLLAVSAAWSTPMRLSDETHDATFPEMYIDPMSKVTHTLWIDHVGDNFYLAYSRVLSNKTQSKPIYLDTEHRVRLSHIIGEGNGKHLMVAYDAKRSQGDKLDCAAASPQACYEIFFTESLDGGKTWTKSVMIQHDNVNDVKDRKGPRITYVKENKVVALTYWCNGPMAFSKRDDSGSFSKETLFLFSQKTAYQNIVYTLKRVGSANVPVLHFFFVNWTYPEENLMYSQSANLGNTWSTPKRIAFYKHVQNTDSFFRPNVVVDESIVKGTIFASFVLDKKAHLMYSSDSGETWSAAIPTHSGHAVAPRIQICRNLKGQYSKLYLLYSIKEAEGTNSFIFGSFDLKTKTYKDEEFPFAGYKFNWDYMVDCYEDGKRMHVAAIVEDGRNESLGKIFLSYFNSKKSLRSD